MRPLTAVLVILTCATSAQAQLQGWVSVEQTNQRISGRVLDFSHNHGEDRRLVSPILGMPRDLYIYLPPGYTPCKAYPLILYFHGGFGDEHAFLEGGRLEYLDQLIIRGQFPPCIVACPDGSRSGRNYVLEPQSLYINGCSGRYEDHILREVLPFLFSQFSIRPERGAHAILGLSSGGFGALSLAIRHRQLFGTVATLAAPANLRYSNVNLKYFDEFCPETYRWQDRYSAHAIVGVYLHGLVRIKAKSFMESVFGSGDSVVERISRVNPADLLFTSGIQPGELAIYLNYGGQDNFNFDAQAESFAWLAGQRGIGVTLARDPEADHSLKYFRDNQQRAWHWLANYLLPPVDRIATGHALQPLPD